MGKVLRVFIAISLIIGILSACNQEKVDKVIDETKEPLKVAMLFPGNTQDKGFMETGLRGLIRAQERLGVEISYVDKVPADVDKIAEELRKLANKNPDFILAHGGQSSEATKIVSEEFPDIKFTVIQGNVTGKNLSSYFSLQKDSAWLSGALAGLLTKTNVVGHISGTEIGPNLDARAAFAQGLKYTNPNATFLTHFTGDLDDAVLAKRAAVAEINAGADIIFTMLNGARIGVTEVCKEYGVYQIGNVKDWYPEDYSVFIASAVNDVSIPVYNAIMDFLEGEWEANKIVEIGLDTKAVRLARSPDISDEIKQKIKELEGGILNGSIKIKTDYSGTDFIVRTPGKK